MEPVNFEVHVWNKLQQIEKRRAERQNYKDQLEACDTIRLTNERLVELSDLCKQYGIPDFAESGVRLSDRVLLDQFVNGIGGSFLAYKRGANIERTFVRCNFKERGKTKAEQKIKEVIDQERNNQHLRRNKRNKPFRPSKTQTFFNNRNSKNKMAE